MPIFEEGGGLPDRSSRSRHRRSSYRTTSRTKASTPEAAPAAAALATMPHHETGSGASVSKENFAPACPSSSGAGRLVSSPATAIEGREAFSNSLQRAGEGGREEGCS